MFVCVKWQVMYAQGNAVEFTIRAWQTLVYANTHTHTHTAGKDKRPHL